MQHLSGRDAATRAGSERSDRVPLPGRARGRLVLLSAALASLSFSLIADATTTAVPAVSFTRSAGAIGAHRTIIVVNGGPGLDSQFTFRGLRGLATASRRVVAYDQRGVGRTPMPQLGPSLNDDYSLAAFVADLEALRQRLGVARIDLVGHSFGALLAAAYTAAHPSRVRSLALVAGLPVSLEAQFEGDARFEKRLARLQQRGLVPKELPETCAERHAVLVPVYVGNPGRAPAIRKALGRSVCDDVVGAIVNDSITADPRRRELETALADYHGPALVAIGALDPFGVKWADDAAEPLSGARLTKSIVPSAGHFLWLESPTFLPLLTAFIDRT